MLLPTDIAAFRASGECDQQRLWSVIDQLEAQLSTAMRAIGMIDVAQSCDNMETIRATCRSVYEALGNAEPWETAAEIATPRKAPD